MSTEKKEKKQKNEKAATLYLTVRYEAMKRDTKEGKEMLDPENKA